MPKPLLYLVLGTPGSGRREVIADLIHEGFSPDEGVLSFLPETEASSPFDAQLGRVVRWSFEKGEALKLDCPSPCEAAFLFFDCLSNPVDQFEAVQAWLPRSGLELGRIFCLVSCSFAQAQEGLLPWYDACIHFADVVLLNHREDVPNRWVSEFVGRYQKQHFPCLFELVKMGQVKNPAMLLEPQARRISLAFDEVGPLALPPEAILLDEEGEEIDSLDEAPKKKAPAKGKSKGKPKAVPKGKKDKQSPEEVAKEDRIQVDPYFERRPGGRRVKEIPLLRDFLPGSQP